MPTCLVMTLGLRLSISFVDAYFLLIASVLYRMLHVTPTSLLFFACCECYTLRYLYCVLFIAATAITATSHVDH